MYLPFEVLTSVPMLKIQGAVQGSDKTLRNKSNHVLWANSEQICYFYFHFFDLLEAKQLFLLLVQQQD